MVSESQADAIREIEQALAALRSGGRRGPREHRGGPRGMARPPWGDGPPPWGDGPPPWGDGPPPWAGGHHGGPGHGGLSGAARFRLLEALSRLEADTSMSVSEVAEAIGVDQPRASRVVADSVERGLVSRSHDHRDARRSVVELTAAGRAHLDAARASRRGAVTQALAGFSPTETETLAALLTRFAAAWPAPSR